FFFQAEDGIRDSSVTGVQTCALPISIGYRCPASEVPDAIERLLRRYLEDRYLGENLRQFFARHQDEELREFLAGEFVEAVARDRSEERRVGKEGRTQGARDQ